MSISAPNGPAIELVGLTKRFGRTLAVNNLSLAIPRQHLRADWPERGGQEHDDQNADGNALNHGRAGPRAGDRRCEQLRGRKAAGRLRPRNAPYLSLDARWRGDRLLQSVLPHVERPDVPRNA